MTARTLILPVAEFLASALAGVALVAIAVALGVL